MINRFDYSLKKQMMSPKKIYFIDQALAVKIGFRFSQDHGRLLENIVFLELKRRGFEVFYHQNKKECDFIIRDGAKIVAAIQVCVDLDSPKTREREIAGLREAMEDYSLDSGLIITLDILEEYENIHIVPVWRWLLNIN
jgi:predicted AAA+ superfamily ATPase